MAWAPRFDLASFEGLTPHARADVVRMLVDALVYANRLWLPLHPKTPPLYQSGVVFAREPIAPETNWWRDIPATLALGHGHCVALAAWRIAELREKGERVRVIIDEWQYPDEDGRTEFHIMLERANGQREDPARRLGMP